MSMRYYPPTGGELNTFLSVHKALDLLCLNRDIAHQVKGLASGLYYNIIFQADAKTLGRDVNTRLYSKYHIGLHRFVQ